MSNSNRPGWTLALELDPSAETPLFLQLARAIAHDVQRGRLRPGDTLPGSRTLASSLGVHRNTVLAALRELAAEGFVDTSPAQRTFIARELPAQGPARSRRARQRARAGFAVDVATPVPTGEPAAITRGDLPLLGGVPDLRHVPRIALARAIRRVLTRDVQLLGYGDARGDARLRQALAHMLAQQRGLAIEGDDILVTRGSQMAIDLVARMLLRRGDTVAVEALGYRPAWEALGAYGARLVPVPVDEHGLDVDALARLARRRKLRAVYVTPHHQYPTTVTLQAARRMALLGLAQTHGFAVIEDDYDHEFHYDGRPLLPLAARDDAGVVIYVGTLSKVLAPGLRLGYAIAPPPLHEMMVRARVRIDRQGDRVLERALAELFEDGEISRHVLRMRRIYRARRDAFVPMLRDVLGDVLSFEEPTGGLAVWAHAPGVDVSAWSERAAARRVLMQAGPRFTFDGSRPSWVRLGFSALDERGLRRAVAILRDTLAGRSS